MGRDTFHWSRLLQTPPNLALETSRDAVEGALLDNWSPLVSCALHRCKKFGIPIEKIYNKTQREKFAWAIDMAGEDFEF